MSITREKLLCLNDKGSVLPSGIVDDDNECKDHFEWTFAKYVMLLELSIVLFFNFASFSILATFFPSEVSWSGSVILIV